VEGNGNFSGRLKDYPAAKIIVSCGKCALRVQYDKQAMLRAGGDRPLTHLHDDIRRRHGCPRMGPRANMYDNCDAIFDNILPAGNSYLAAKGR